MAVERTIVAPNPDSGIRLREDTAQASFMEVVGCLEDREWGKKMFSTILAIVVEVPWCFA